MNDGGAQQIDTEIEIGEKSRVRGKIRQTLKKIAQLPKDKRDELIPEMETLKEYIRVLAQKTTPGDRVREIESHFAYELKPQIEEYFEENSEILKKQEVDLDEDIAISMRVAKVKARVNTLISKIAKLPEAKKAELAVEKAKLDELSRTLSKKPDDGKLQQIENILAYDIEQTIANATATPQSGVGSSPSKSFADMSKEMLQEDMELKKLEFQTRKLENMLESERQRTDALTSNNSSKNGQTTYAQVKRPVIDPVTHQPMRDKEGEIIYEQVMQPMSPNDPMAMMQMWQMMQPKQDSEMKMLLQTMLTMIQNQNTNKNDGFMKYVIESNNRMWEAMNTKKDDPQVNVMREEMREIREESRRNEADLHKMQLSTIYKELQEYKEYARRDPLEEMEKQKERLKRLGIVGDTADSNKSSEEKSLEESVKVLNNLVDKLDGAVREGKEMMMPIAKAQADIIRGSSNSDAPLDRVRNMSEHDKTAKYREILANLEDLEDGEGEGY